MLEKTIQIINTINQKLGKWISWLSLALVILVCLIVAMRYLMDYTIIWMDELSRYFFAYLFLYGAGYTFQKDRHVRVDVFYDKWTIKRKAWINLIGGVLFLIPWCVILVQVGWHYTVIAFNMNESSSQAGGLPALYLMKSAIFLGIFFLLLQGIASVLSAFLILTSKTAQTTN